MKKWILVILLVLINHLATAQVDSSTAIKAIMGEARGEGFRGMVAVGCAIRNRGHFRGVYGLRDKKIYNEPQWVWDLAKKAWEESAKKDIVDKASHWESVDFKKPYWADSMIVTVKIGKHIFYKPKNR